MRKRFGYGHDTRYKASCVERALFMSFDTFGLYGLWGDFCIASFFYVYSRDIPESVILFNVCVLMVRIVVFGLGVAFVVAGCVIYMYDRD